MTSQEGSTGPAVRRATALPQMSGSAGTDPALVPRAPAPVPAAGPAEGEAEAAPGRTETMGAAVAVPEPAAPEPATAEPDRESEAAATTAAGADGRTDPPAAAAGEPPSPRPGKPWLAAAAIGGSLLIGVPLLFMGLGDDDGPRTRPAASSRTSSDVLLRDEDSVRQAPGGYVPASPSATPSPKPKPTEVPKASASAQAPAPAVSDAETSGRKTAQKKEAAGSPAAVRRSVVRAGGALPTGARLSTATDVLIKNVVTGLCVDVPDYGKGKVNGTVEQFTCDGTARDNQLWDLVVNQKGAGPGGADLFTVRNSKDNYCLDLPDFGGKPVHTRVYEYYCRPGSGDNQMWFLEKRANGAFWIRNHASNGRCLDVAGSDGSGGRGAALMLFDCSDQDDHLWSFS
ncbi:RICIN domain-containing protein [Streptomyces sp. NBC_01102]|uniref:RICIN domain-containing protein n=1 Tax=unclassified Streptomyces TaxID=2593676 RepID=UPI00386B9AB6|nr:RICIN domain-containing protein [Streptomyces sp. NBC_01102]